MTTAEDPIHFLPTGDIAVRLAGTSAPLVLPRPSFGQIKRLLRTEGIVQDELNRIMLDAQAAATALTTEASALSVTTDNLEQLGAVRARSREVADRATEDTAAVLEQWWTEVFTVLREGSVPDQDTWPGQFMDPKLPGRMIQHWRFVPTGPG